MLTINSNFKDIKPGGVFALGNFDGVHLGHKQIIKEAINIAAETSSYPGVIVFEPHPRKFFSKNDDNFYLSNIKTKKYLLAEFGLESCVILDFDQKMANRTPEEFVSEIIVEKIKPSSLIIGYDFKFGRNRSGNAQDLLELCNKFKISVEIIDKQIKDGFILSSSMVREFLVDNNFKAAESMLGHKWMVKGTVQEGDKRGREIGFPTANLSVDNLIQLTFGVYAVEVNYGGKTFNAVANYGLRPTFDGEDIFLEVYLFDFSDDLYGKDIIVSFVEFIRKEKKFDGLESLRDQIDIDSKKAQEILNKYNV